MKLYIFRTVRLVIISSLFTVHSAMVYVIHVCRELSSRTWSCSKAVYKHVWHIPLLIVQWINCWWWPDELSETCRVSWQNKFVKLVHLVGFITKKFVTMHGHMSRCTVTCYDARSHVTMHGHMLRCTVTWTYKSKGDVSTQSYFGTVYFNSIFRPNLYVYSQSRGCCAT